jgi:hypothetical protein
MKILQKIKFFHELLWELFHQFTVILEHEHIDPYIAIHFTFSVHKYKIIF